MKKINYPILILSLFLSVSVNLKIIIDSSLERFIKSFHINFFFIGKVLIVCIIFYILFYYLFKLIDKIPLSKNKLILNKKNIIIIFLLIFVPTMIYLLSHYPGVYLNDTLFMLYYPVNKMNPVIYGMFISIVFFSLKVFVSSSTSIFILSLVQAIISCIVVSYGIVWFNKRINNKLLTIILVCYYSLLPIISSYNMSLDKDTPFSILMLLFFIFVFEIVESKGGIITNKKFLIKLIIISSLCVFIRRNGILVIGGSLFLLFLLYGLKYKRYWFLTLLIIMLLPGVENIALSHWDRIYNKSEVYAIPIQQVGYLVKYYPNRLSDDDYKVLSKVIKNPKETIQNNYNVFEVDKIKFNDNFDKDKFNKYEKEFLALWIKKYPKNISAYTKSFLLNDYDLWSVNIFKKRQSIFDVASIYGIDKDIQIHNKRILPKSIYNFLMKYYDIFNTYLNPAGCFIILMITNVYFYTRRKKEMLIISLPLIILWFILMIGTPCSSALRYMAPYLYILPIIILYGFKITREGDYFDGEKKSKRKFSKKRKISE